jgi:hypothetical protein
MGNALAGTVKETCKLISMANADDATLIEPIQLALA